MKIDPVDTYYAYNSYTNNPFISLDNKIKDISSSPLNNAIGMRNELGHAKKFLNHVLMSYERSQGIGQNLDLSV
jgi:hypothetical protein